MKPTIEWRSSLRSRRKKRDRVISKTFYDQNQYTLFFTPLMIDLGWDGMTQWKGNPEQTKVFSLLKWVRSSYVSPRMKPWRCHTTGSANAARNIRTIVISGNYAGTETLFGRNSGRDFWQVIMNLSRCRRSEPVRTGSSYGALKIPWS